MYVYMHELNTEKVDIHVLSLYEDNYQLPILGLYIGVLNGNSTGPYCTPRSNSLLFTTLQSFWCVIFLPPFMSPMYLSHSAGFSNSKIMPNYSCQLSYTLFIEAATVDLEIHVTNPSLLFIKIVSP